MSKFWDDVLKEKGRYSRKNIILAFFTVISIINALGLTITLFTHEDPADSHVYIFGELLAFVGLLLGVTVAAKHDKLQNHDIRKEEQMDP